MASREDTDLKAVAFSEAAEHVRRMLVSEDVGFIATAGGHWHAVGVDAWVGKLRASGERRKGIVLLIPVAKGGLVIEGKDLPLCREDGNVAIIRVDRVLDRGGPGRFAHMMRMAFRLIRLWLLRPGRGSRPGRPVLRIAAARDAAAAVFALAEIGMYRFLRGRDIRFVVLDEGLGTYTSQAMWKYARRLDRSREGRIVSHRRIDSLLYNVWRWTQMKIAKRYPIEERSVFVQDTATGSLVRNPPIVADYQRAVRSGGARSILQRRDNPLALIVPQPWSEYEQVDRSDEVEYMAWVIDRLVEAGYDVYVKPHPREEIGKYDCIIESRPGRCRILAADRAVERIFGEMRKGDIVVGLSSTSLMTASLVYGLETFTMGRGLIRAAETGEWLQAAHQVFKELAGHSVGDFQEQFGVD
jgi:hypothetical protein